MKWAIVITSWLLYWLQIESILSVQYKESPAQIISNTEKLFTILSYTTLLFILALDIRSSDLCQLAVQIVHVGGPMHKNILFRPLHELVLGDVAGSLFAQWVVYLLGKLDNDWIFWIVFAVFDLQDKCKRSADAQQQDRLRTRFKWNWNQETTRRMIDSIHTSSSSDICELWLKSIRSKMASSLPTSFLFSLLPRDMMEINTVIALTLSLKEDRSH